MTTQVSDSESNKKLSRTHTNPPPKMRTVANTPDYIPA